MVLAEGVVTRPASKWFLCAWLVLSASACKCESSEAPPSAADPAAEAAHADPVAARAPEEFEVRKLLAEADLCDFRHRGLAIDVASDWADVHRGFTVGPFDDVIATKRAAIATGGVRTRKLVYDFWTDRPTTNVHVELRAQGNVASRLSLDLDTTRLGEQRLDKDEPKVLRFGPLAKPLPAGHHQLTLRFPGRNSADDQTRAWLEWIRVFVPDNFDHAYVAPTKENVLQDVVLHDEPRRGLALRAPGSVRCPAFPVRGTRLKLEVGYWGSGTGVAQVKAHTAEGRSVVLAEREVKGEEEGGKWIPLELTLDAFHDQLVALEFVASEASQGGRVVFAEPELRLATRPPTLGVTRNVIVVVAGGLRRQLVPPWSDRQRAPNLFRFAEQSVVFEGYRSSSTIVSGVVATLLTGARPVEHQMLDPAARVPKALKLTSERMRRRGGVSGFFTNVPYSFRAFGFDRGWTVFEQFSPVDDVPATQPLHLARRWLETQLAAEETTPRLMFVHLSGAHPPWDVPLEQAKTLPPKDYSGQIDPRRAAGALRELRDRTRGSRLLRADDWIRLEALQGVAVAKLDESFGLLMQSLQDSGQWDESLVLFMGDVAMGDAPSVPFAPFSQLEEARLAVPLLAKLPGATDSHRAHFRFGPEAIARTVQEALGIEWSGAASVPRLGDIAVDRVGLLGSAGLLAMQGHTYAYYLGSWRLSGSLGDAPSLCQLEVDPACQTEALDAEPFVAQWMWRALLRALRDYSGDDLRREGAQIDEKTRSGLQVYGL
jgi:hypothetical protein